MKRKIFTWVKQLEHHADRWWFPYAIAFAAFIDYFIIVVPMIAVLISSVMLAPKKWVKISIFMSVGSSLGVLLFSFLICHYGLQGIERFAPELPQSQSWQLTESWIHRHGSWAVFLISSLPMTDHASIAIVSLAKMPLEKIMGLVTLAKVIKYGCFGWFASTAPEKLLKLKWLNKKIAKLEKSN